MNQKYKKPYRRKGAKRIPAKPSKSLTRAVKQIVKKNIETKTINVPDNAGTLNSIAINYTALTGAQYFVQDVFKVKQGVQDSTAIGGLNRIGDRVKGVGFLCDYYFTNRQAYALAPYRFLIPFVKLRITIFRTAFGTPLLPTTLIYDSNFLSGNTSTLQPINWDEGYVKEVLYDKVHIVRNTLSNQSQDGTSVTNVVTPTNLGNVFHFKKYFKYDHLIKYSDNNTTSPNSTDKPIYCVLSAEVDDAYSGLVPSSETILTYTGYTRAWFKDG